MSRSCSAVERDRPRTASLVDSGSRGGRSSAGRAPGCGPGGRGFESPRSPFEVPGNRRLSIRRCILTAQSVHQLSINLIDLARVRRGFVASERPLGVPRRQAPKPLERELGAGPGSRSYARRRSGMERKCWLAARPVPPDSISRSHSSTADSRKRRYLPRRTCGIGRRALEPTPTRSSSRDAHRARQR